MKSYTTHNSLKLSEELSNVTLVAKDGETWWTHAILLASISDFLKELLLDLSCPGDQVVIILPDNSVQEVEDMLEVVMGKEMERNSLMDMMVIRLKEENKKARLQGTFDINYMNMDVKTSPKKCDKIEKLSQDKIIPTCPFCKDSFVSIKRMQCHVLITHDQEINVGAEYKSKSVRHHICGVCGSSFSKTRMYNKHMTTEHSTISPLKNRCEECQKPFVDRNSHNKHMSTKHAKTVTLPCEVCHKQLSNTSENKLNKHLRKHMRMEHGTISSLDCDICQKSFLKESALYNHRNRHNRNIICDLCGKKFSSRILLAKHNLRIHATEDEKKRAKRYACNFCTFRCYTNNNLKMHEQVHNETLNF